MASVPITIPLDYWKSITVSKQDLELIINYLFENETPLTEKELLPVLVAARIAAERASLLKKQQGDGKIYLPKEHYQPSEKLVFPSLDWRSGKVVTVRSGLNPEVGEFEVVEVEFGDGSKHSFAANLADHKLNQPMEASLDVDKVLSTYGAELEIKFAAALKGDEGLVQIAGRWFPRALLVDVNVGNLNLAEAVLDEANGKPLPTPALLEQVELPENVNPKLIEFSMNYAIQEDERFDEVGPAGEVLWYLHRLEPEDVRQTPVQLRYSPVEYDRSVLTAEMLELEAELNDELSDLASPPEQVEEVVVSLTYPHWRAGTLPVSARVRTLFPTAYESPRVRFTLVDGQTKEAMPAWVVRQNRYVYGLSEWYRKYNLIPGSLIVVRKGKIRGQVIVQARTRRPTKEWVRTVLVGRDGGIVFAMLKQNIAADYNERMIVVVPDVDAVDRAWAQVARQQPPLEVMVMNIMRDLTRLNLQGHVHAQELYSAINIIRRCPPGPLLVMLVTQPGFTHVGDMHFRLVDSDYGRAVTYHYGG
ncbi:MAG: hypothetical protein KKC71_08755 [Chloroflexi bacterium]|nr:hypothetical protein [Chloroflexota bacterium]